MNPAMPTRRNTAPTTMAASCTGRRAPRAEPERVIAIVHFHWLGMTCVAAITRCRCTEPSCDPTVIGPTSRRNTHGVRGGGAGHTHPSDVGSGYGRGDG